MRKSDSHEDAREVCADSTYFQNNLRRVPPTRGTADSSKFCDFIRLELADIFTKNATIECLLVLIPFPF
jgi:hypothetical protein